MCQSVLDTLRSREIRFEENNSKHTKGSLTSSEGCGISVIPVVEYFIGVGAESWLCACILGLQAESMSSMYTVYLPKRSWRLQEFGSLRTHYREEQ